MKNARGGCRYLPNGTDVKYVNGGGSGKPPFRDHLDYLDRQITLLGTGGLLTMLTESGSGTLAGNAHQEAFNQVAKADSVMVAATRDSGPRMAGRETEETGEVSATVSDVLKTLDS